MIPLLKKVALLAIDRPLVGSLLASLRSSSWSVLMLHRFRGNDERTIGHDPEKLRTFLAYLRRIGVVFVSVEELVEHVRASDAGAGRKGPLVAFTVDDGYRDFLDVGAPIFSEFDCPVTAFVVPDVIDRKIWFWWDQIEWIQRHSRSRSLTLEIQGAPFHVTWNDDRGRAGALEALSERMKILSNVSRLEVLHVLSSIADVPIPEVPPPEYQVCSWSELRAAEKQGLRVGAHSLTHPILSRCTDADVQREIMQSITRVGAEVTMPSSVFCYPNGRAEDFGEREMDIVKKSGLSAALTALSARIDTAPGSDPAATWRWQIPRLPYEERRGATARAILG